MTLFQFLYFAVIFYSLFSINSFTNVVQVDILDTSGEMEFPAMRRLCIATAQAFLLVYAVTSTPSFHSIKQCFEEIREQRGDFHEIPIVIVGNKLDLTSTHREVNIEDVSEWVFCELPKLRWMLYLDNFQFFSELWLFFSYKKNKMWYSISYRRYEVFPKNWLYFLHILSYLQSFFFRNIQGVP